MAMPRSQSMGNPGRNIQAAPPNLKKSGALTDAEKDALYRYSHHREEIKEDGELKAATGKTYDKTNKTTVMIPQEKTVKVPVVRKEKEKLVERHVVKASRLVPVTKYKEVKEVDLEDDRDLGVHKSLSRNPQTTVLKTFKTAPRTRMIPYTDFEEQEYDMVVEVPREVIRTRVGHRFDVVKSSKFVDLEEDCVFEMRPVLLKKGESRAREFPDKARHGKAVHGDAVWDGGVHEGWRPEFGADTPDHSRPSTPGSRLGSRPGTGFPQAGMSPTGRPGSSFGGGMSPTGRPGSSFGGGMERLDETRSRTGLSSRPMTGARSAPSLDRTAGPRRGG